MTKRSERVLQNKRYYRKIIKEKGLRNYSDKPPLLLTAYGYGAASTIFRLIVLSALLFCPIPAVNFPLPALKPPMVFTSKSHYRLGFSGHIHIHTQTTKYNVYADSF